MIRFRKKIITLATMVCLAVNSIPVFAYNRDDAVSYANNWATSANPNYYNYIDEGGDCTNFVSQCLYAGGMSKSSKWKPDSAAWILASSFKNYWKSRDYDYRCYSVSVAREQWNTIYNLLWPGDVVQYSYGISSSSELTHSQIITGYNSSSKTTYFAQHSDSYDGFYKNASLKGYLYGRTGTNGFHIHVLKQGA